MLRHLGSLGDDPIAGLATDAASGVWVYGRLGGAMEVGGQAPLTPVADQENAYLVHYDSAGKLLSATRLSAGELLPERIVSALDGAIYLTGTASGSVTVHDAAASPGASPTTAETGPFVLRFTPDGSLSWSRRLSPSAGGTLALDSVVSAAGAVVVAGSFRGILTLSSGALSSDPAHGSDAFLAFLDPLTGAVTQARHVATAGDDREVQVVASASDPTRVRFAMLCDGAFESVGDESQPACSGLFTTTVTATGVPMLTTGKSFFLDTPSQLRLAPARQAGFFLSARYAGTASLPPLPALPSSGGRFLIARCGESGEPEHARSLPDPSVNRIETLVADFDGGLLVGGSGRGCLQGDAGGQVCTGPQNTQNAVAIRFAPDLGLQWGAYQFSSTGPPQGVVHALVLTPQGTLLGASSARASVAVLKQKTPWIAGVDGVVGRFFAP